MPFTVKFPAFTRGDETTIKFSMVLGTFNVTPPDPLHETLVGPLVAGQKALEVSMTYEPVGLVNTSPPEELHVKFPLPPKLAVLLLSCKFPLTRKIELLITVPDVARVPFGTPLLILIVPLFVSSVPGPSAAVTVDPFTVSAPPLSTVV
jgi:hypothetical protein